MDSGICLSSEAQAPGTISQRKSRASGLAVLEDLYKEKLGAGYAVEQHRAMQKGKS